MLLFLLDIIIISVLILSFASFIFLYINPKYNIDLLKKNIINQTCSATEYEEEGDSNINELYNISPNNFTYEQAENVCRELKGKLATKKQIDEAFEKGANWCNYGWSEGQTAYYPIQGSFYSKLQSDPNLGSSCGNIGVNGGYFKDPNLRFGVNCFGIKPVKDINVDTEYKNILEMVVPSDEKSQHQSTSTRESILPFNMSSWSISDDDLPTEVQTGNTDDESVDTSS